MNAVATSEVPTQPIDTYGGLLREGETPEQALRRLERRSNFTKVIGSDEGQRLLAAATAQVRATPNGGIRAKRQAKIDTKVHKLVDDAIAGGPVVTVAALAGAIAAAEAEVDDLDPFALLCVGSNHVPGHTPGCADFRAPVVAAQLLDLPLEQLDIGENIRVDPGEIEGLAASILETGLQSPIRAIGPGPNGRYRAVNGQRRILASRLAKLPTIQAVVEASADVDAPGPRRSIAQLAENLQKKDMNPIEEAAALRAVLDGTKGLTQAALAKSLGRSEPWIASTLGLLKAPTEVQALVRSDEISIAHAKAVAGLPAADQVRLAKSAAKNGISAHSLEESAKWERRSQTERKDRSGFASAAAARGLAALAKAATPKDVALYVYATDWRVQDEDVRKIIRAEGYTIAGGWARSGKDRWAKCDCTALQLQIRDGEGSTIEPACASDAHYRAFEKERNAAATEKRAADEAERLRLPALVRAAVGANDMIPTVGRMILRAIDGYQMKNWSEYSKIEDGEIAAAIADKLTSESSVRGGYDAKGALPIKTVLRELGAVDEDAPAPKAKAKAARR